MYAHASYKAVVRTYSIWIPQDSMRGTHETVQGTCMTYWYVNLQSYTMYLETYKLKGNILRRPELSAGPHSAALSALCPRAAFLLLFSDAHVKYHAPCSFYAMTSSTHRVRFRHVAARLEQPMTSSVIWVSAPVTKTVSLFNKSIRTAQTVPSLFNLVPCP